MEKYFDLPRIGALWLEHTFYVFDDEPILFVCKDDEDQRYLCSCCRMYEKWVIGPVDGSALLDLIDDKAAIRAIFQGCRDGLFLAVWDGERFDVRGSFPDELLPKEGALLGLEGEKTGEYRKRLEKELRRREAFVSRLSASLTIAPHLRERRAADSFVWDCSVQLGAAMGLQSTIQKCYKDTFTMDIPEFKIDWERVFAGAAVEAAKKITAPLKIERQPAKYEEVSQGSQFDQFAA